MAILTGSKVGEPIGVTLDQMVYLAPSLLTMDDTAFSLANVSNAYSPVKGSFVPLPLPTTTHILGGSSPSSINSPFYSRPQFVKDTVLLDGTYLGIGMVSEELSLSFNVWSPYSTKKEVASFGFLDTTAGLSLSGISVGTVFNPYEEKTVDLTVASEGIPVIDTYFYISFTGDSTLFYLQLKGARIGQFYVMEPNWQDGIKVEHRFLTSVFSSQDMSETRKVLRNRPARSLTATVPFYTKHDASRMWALLRDCSKQTTMHPFYPDKSAMTASSTSTRVYCPTEYRRFEAGKYVFLVRDKSYPSSKYFEIVRIHEVFADGFSTDDAILNSYTTGDAVYPALACLASFEIAQELMTDDKATVEMTLEEVYDTGTLDNENGTYTPIVRASYPTLDVDLTFSEPSVKIVCAGGVEDSGRGFVQHVKGVPYIEQTVTAFCRTKEECWKTIGFFNHLRGRGKPFWVRSEIDWIDVASSSGSSSIIITNPVYLKDMDYLKYLWITDSTGAFDVVRVVASSLTVDGIQLLLAASSLVDIATVRQAHPVRLSEDVITEEYLTDSVMVATFTVQELQGI